jgi:hypothetical protein
MQLTGSISRTKDQGPKRNPKSSSSTRHSGGFSILVGSFGNKQDEQVVDLQREDSRIAKRRIFWRECGKSTVM